MPELLQLGYLARACTFIDRSRKCTDEHPIADCLIDERRKSFDLRNW